MSNLVIGACGSCAAPMRAPYRRRRSYGRSYGGKRGYRSRYGRRYARKGSRTIAKQEAKIVREIKKYGRTPQIEERATKLLQKRVASVQKFKERYEAAATPSTASTQSSQSSGGSWSTATASMRF